MYGGRQRDTQYTIRMYGGKSKSSLVANLSRSGAAVHLQYHTVPRSWQVPNF
jgi:hypothetical protein